MKTIKTIITTTFLILFAFTMFASCQILGWRRSAGRNSEALLAFERAESFYKRGALSEAIEEYTTAIELEPEWAEAFLGRGNARVWGLDADYELAQEDYDRAAALDPKYLDYAQAVRYNMDRDYLRAIETFDRVIQNNVNLMDSYSYRANLHSAIGELGKSITDHGEAINIYPEFDGNYANRAYVYIRMRQYDMAIDDCDRAIDLNPDSFYGYTFRGEAYYRKKNVILALADLSRAIQINPDNKGGNASYPYHLRASIYYNENDFYSAIPDYSQVILLLPDALGPYIDRGYCYLQTGDYDKATADIDTALRLEPGNEDALWVRSEIHAARYGER